MKSKKTKSTPKLTQSQKDYDKQVKYWENRLKRKARAINKRGFSFLENLMPEKPEKRLKSYITKLKERVENIYDYAYYVKEGTGEYLTGLQRRGEERRRAAQKAVRTRQAEDSFWYEDYEPPEPQPFTPREPTQEERETLPSESLSILDRVYAEIERWQPEPSWSSELSALKREDVDSLGSIIDGAIRSLGKTQVAWNLANYAEEFETLCIEVMYVSGSKFKETGREGIMIKLNKIARMVWGRPLTVSESKSIFEQSERFNESE